MKKKLLFKTFALTLGLLFYATIGWSQLLVEDFDYPIGDLLNAHGWTAHGNAGTQAIDVTSGLSFAGYLGSGIGGAANLDATGEDVNKTFTAQTAGTVYAAFVIQTQSSNSAGYFLHFGQSVIATTFFTRVWINATGNGVGLGSSTPATYQPITAGVPTLLVIKYVIASKVSSLFVFNTFPTEEPASANTTFTETGTYANVGSIALRQYNAAQRVIVDGIRVATNWADAVKEAGGTPATATPLFSHPSQNYFSPFDLEITCSTPASTIYYTLDGTDPNQSSTQYTVPINISTTTTVRAIAYATGFDPSSIGQVILTFPSVTDVATIAELRAGTAGVLYRLTGEAVMTFKQIFRNQKFIQDATAAILIDDLAGKITTNYAVGDGITGIIGSVATFGNMIQFTPATDPGAATSTGNVIVPQIITISEMVTNFENYESELVQLNGINFTAGGTGNFANGIAYAITDESKATASFRTTFYDVDYIGQPIPAVPANVTGICNSRAEGNFITSRNLADIVLPPTIKVTSPNGGELAEQGTTYEITWFAASFEGDVEVVLHTPILKGGLLLGTVPATDQSFSWNVTQDAGDYFIVVKAVGLDEPFDVSDAPFSIIPPIDIRITEIMYNSPEDGNDTLEFIEIYNNGTGIVNLENWKFSKGVVFTFPEVLINPTEYVVVAFNETAIYNTFGLDVLQWASGSLSNSGEQIELMDAFLNVRAFVNFDDVTPWPVEPDGQGPSLTFCDPALENNDPANWSASTNLAAVNADGNGVYCTPGAGCNTNEDLVMNYPAGWMGISSYLEPGKTSMENLFAAAYGKMTILLAEDGIFWPGQNINTIGDWDSYKGYKVKFNQPIYFVYNGNPTPTPNVTLEPGIHFFPVLSDVPALVNDVLVPHGADIAFAFDIVNGGIYWPEGGIVPGMNGSFTELYPGYGYLIKVINTITIDFNVGDASGKIAEKAVPQIANPAGWNTVSKTGEQHIISVKGTQNLETGDVIGVFDASLTCTGMAVYDGVSPLPLVVYGNDITTSAKDGMNAQEVLTIKVYRQGIEMDASAVYDQNIVNHDGLFVSNGLSVINDLKFGATGVNDANNSTYSIFPNPSTGQFTLSVAGKNEILITNAAGQMVYSTVSNGSTIIDLSAQPKGVYFIKLTGDSSVSFDKIVIR
jgi:hypothetical protein